MKEKEYIINEIQIINQIEHPNILKFNGIDYTDLNGYNKVIYVCEYSPNGSLHDYLSNKSMINVSLVSLFMPLGSTFLGQQL